MAELDINNFDTSILEDIERLAYRYTMLNIVSNIIFNVGAIYLFDQIITYTVRLFGCPC